MFCEKDYYRKMKFIYGYKVLKKNLGAQFFFQVSKASKRKTLF